jgi:hypothetical protein
MIQVNSVETEISELSCCSGTFAEISELSCCSGTFAEISELPCCRGTFATCGRRRGTTRRVASSVGHVCGLDLFLLIVVQMEGKREESISPEEPVYLGSLWWPCPSRCSILHGAV